MDIAIKAQSDDIALNGSTADPKPRVQSALRAISILLAVSESSNGLKVKGLSPEPSPRSQNGKNYNRPRPAFE
jgi:hypothetical protein